MDAITQHSGMRLSGCAASVGTVEMEMMGRRTGGVFFLILVVLGAKSVHTHINAVGRNGGGRGGSDGLAKGAESPFSSRLVYFLESLSGDWGGFQNRMYSC